MTDLYVDDRDDIFDTDDTNDWDEDATDSGDGGDPEADRPFDFDPRRAGLDEVSADEAAKYIADNRTARPWLAPAVDRHPQVQRIYAALDQGQGHAIPRHDDFGDDTFYDRRVRYNEDPAQLDDAKRAAGIDGTEPGNKKHFCAASAARIHDAAARGQHRPADRHGRTGAAGTCLRRGTRPPTAGSRRGLVPCGHRLTNHVAPDQEGLGPRGSRGPCRRDRSGAAR